MVQQIGGDGYREGQYPGLGRAASEIFFSESRVSFSGYAELANVFDGGKVRDTSSDEIELYFTNLVRIVPFLGIRLTDRWFWITEFGFEYFEGNGETEYHFFPETYMDYIAKSWLGIRVGIQPLNIGYINNNDEPLLFLSVNRPETERIIIPSEWIEVGVSVYGEFASGKLNYALGITNGVIASKFKSPSWIRNGAETQYESFNSPAFHGQLSYLPKENLTLSLSGYYNNSGRSEDIIVDGSNTSVSAPLSIIAGYTRWDKGAFSIIGMGTLGSLGETDKVFVLTGAKEGSTQVSGGPATELTPKEITGGWNEGLKNIEKLHHQIGNLTINVNNKSASATCYGIAIHYRNISDSENTRTFVGSYEFHLNKGSESWKISSIKFNLKFITGNLELG